MQCEHCDFRGGTKAHLWLHMKSRHMEIMDLSKAKLFKGEENQTKQKEINDIKNQVSVENLMFFPTSFNGDYIGYLSHGKHYYSNENFETRDMNIFGPKNSDYITEVTVRLLDKFVKLTDSGDKDKFLP